MEQIERIGLEFAKQYSEAGWNVVACSRHPKSTDLELLKKRYPKLSMLEIDVCNQSQIDRLATDLQNIPIDLLINLAGIYGKNDQTFERSVLEICRKFL